MMRETNLNRREFVVGAGMTAAGSTIGGVGTAKAHEEREVDDQTNGQTDDQKEDHAGDRTEPSLIAHRGFAGVYPENTVGAVQLAARHGADMIEIDIMPTAEGDVVVFHDNRLWARDGGERGLTDTSGVVWETPTEEVLTAEVLESGETVPLLSEVLDAIPTHVGVNIEFKNPGSFDLRFAEALCEEELEQQKDIWRPFTKDALAIASEYEHSILVSSFYEAALVTVRETDSTIPAAFLFWDSIEEGLTVTRRYDCEAVNPPYNLIQNTPFFGDEYYTEGPFADIDLVEVAHDEDRSVNAYTLGTWYQAEQLAAAGVDGLIANYPNLLGFDSGQ
jgi:glycerophosphoryl diester phosphodiesterase